MPESISGALFDHATLYAALHRRKPPLETLRDASRLRCVARAQNMRREPSRINDLHRTHRAPPNDERRNRKTPGSSGADLSVVRHLRHRLTHNFLTMNRLPLCPEKGEISGLVRHPCVENPYSLSHNPADDADLPFVRHFRPLLTNKPLAMSSLSLCPQKGEISGLVRHRSAYAPIPCQIKIHSRRARRSADEYGDSNQVPLSQDFGPQLQPPGIVHLEQVFGCPPHRRTAFNAYAPNQKVLHPQVTSRVKQWRHLAHHRVNTGEIGAFLKVAPMAGQRQIVDVIAPAMLFGDNMLNVVRQLAVHPMQQTILAAAFCATPDQVPRGGIHR
jgi:hypothetical protein